MTTLRAQFIRELIIQGRAKRTIHAYVASLAAVAKHYGILANHARGKQLPRVRAAIAAAYRSAARPRSSRYAAGNAAKEAEGRPSAPPWQPACPECGGSRSVCIALIQPDGRIIALPAAARFGLRLFV
ncbi:MAG: hypothetical protein IPL39_18025 [Opitutaceae bacterium]|nr:hypothetical protein [Opitutaceae bacterium]